MAGAIRNLGLTAAFVAVGCSAPPPAEAPVLAPVVTVTLPRVEPPPPSPVSVVILLDLSGSMRFPVSSTEPATRIEWAKKALGGFLASPRRGKTGLVVFGESAFVMLPATDDREKLVSLLGTARLGSIDPKGTAFGEAIAIGVSSLRKTNEQKALLLVTDADHEEQRDVDRRAADLATEQGIPICIVQIGAGDGTLQVSDGVDLFNKPRFVPVVSRRDSELMKLYAERSHGAYATVTEPQALDTVIARTCGPIFAPHR